MSKTVLVTGATGFVGGQLVRALAQRGDTIRVLARNPSRLATDIDVDVVVGDLADESSPLEAAASGCDVVFHCAGITGDRVDWTTARAVNLEGTRRIAIAARQSNVARFVHVSSVAVYGFDRGNFTEDDPRRKVGEPYIDTKSGAEEVCEAVFADAPNALRILRPAIIYGPGDTGMMPRLVELLRSGVPMIGDGAAHVGLVHISDVIAALIAVADHDGPHTIFNVKGPDDVCWADLVSWLTKQYDLPKTRKMPVFVARIVAAGMAALAALRLGPAPSLTKFAIKFLTEHREYSTERLCAELITPRVSCVDGLPG